MEGGELPVPRLYLQATLVDNILFVTGGGTLVDGGFKDLTSVLAWDPVAEFWQQAGHLAVGRDSHAAVAVPASIVECSGCSAMSFSALDHLLVAVSFFISQKCLQIGKAE